MRMRVAIKEATTSVGRTTGGTPAICSALAQLPLWWQLQLVHPPRSSHERSAAAPHIANREPPRHSHDGGVGRL